MESSSLYRIPPPKINLINPKKIATIQMIMPPFDLPRIESTKPRIANGILNQFIHPSRGINPSNIPINARIPNNLPIVFISLGLRDNIYLKMFFVKIEFI